MEKIQWVYDRIVSLSLKMKYFENSIILVNTPQQGMPITEKDAFYENLQEVVYMVRYKERLVICGDWNDHIGTDRESRGSTVGHFGIGNFSEKGDIKHLSMQIIRQW